MGCGKLFDPRYVFGLGAVPGGKLVVADQRPSWQNAQRGDRGKILSGSYNHQRIEGFPRDTTVQQALAGVRWVCTSRQHVYSLLNTLLMPVQIAGGWQRGCPAKAVDFPSWPVCPTLPWMDRRSLRDGSFIVETPL
jgi:hypothetical protein